jgi:hypothetical protein
LQKPSCGEASSYTFGLKALKVFSVSRGAGCHYKRQLAEIKPVKPDQGNACAGKELHLSPFLQQHFPLISDHGFFRIKKISLMVPYCRTSEAEFIFLFSGSVFFNH